MKKIILLAAFLIILAGVGFFSLNKPKLDAQTKETINASLEKMKNSLSKEEAEKFKSSMQTLLFSDLDIRDLMSGKTQPNELYVKNFKKYEGKTANELITAAEAIKIERKNEQKKQAIAEIKEIEEKIANAKEAEKILAKVEIIKSRFYKDNTGYMVEPIIELTVKNGTDKAISRAYFSAVLASPNRSVPWIKDEFNYDIKGGLEPNETANWKLAPNSFGDWGKTDAPKDAILTVTVVKVDGADEKELASIKGADEKSLKRLEELKKFVIEEN